MKRVQAATVDDDVDDDRMLMVSEDNLGTIYVSRTQCKNLLDVQQVLKDIRLHVAGCVLSSAVVLVEQPRDPRLQAQALNGHLTPLVARRVLGIPKGHDPKEYKLELEDRQEVPLERISDAPSFEEAFLDEAAAADPEAARTPEQQEAAEQRRHAVLCEFAWAMERKVIVPSFTQSQVIGTCERLALYSSVEGPLHVMRGLLDAVKLGVKNPELAGSLEEMKTTVLRCLNDEVLTTEDRMELQTDLVPWQNDLINMMVETWRRRRAEAGLDDSCAPALRLLQPHEATLSSNPVVAGGSSLAPSTSMVTDAVRRMAAQAQQDMSQGSRIKRAKLLGRGDGAQPTASGATTVSLDGEEVQGPRAPRTSSTTNREERPQGRAGGTAERSRATNGAAAAATATGAGARVASGAARKWQQPLGGGLRDHGVDWRGCAGRRSSGDEGAAQSGFRQPSAITVKMEEVLARRAEEQRRVAVANDMAADGEDSIEEGQIPPQQHDGDDTEEGQVPEQHQHQQRLQDEAMPHTGAGMQQQHGLLQQRQQGLQPPSGPLPSAPAPAPPLHPHIKPEPRLEAEGPMGPIGLPPRAPSPLPPMAVDAQPSAGLAPPAAALDPCLPHQHQPLRHPAVKPEPGLEDVPTGVMTPPPPPQPLVQAHELQPQQLARPQPQSQPHAAVKAEPGLGSAPVGLGAPAPRMLPPAAPTAASAAAVPASASAAGDPAHPSSRAQGSTAQQGRPSAHVKQEPAVHSTLGQLQQQSAGDPAPTSRKAPRPPRPLAGGWRQIPLDAPPPIQQPQVLNGGWRTSGLPTQPSGPSPSPSAHAPHAAQPSQPSGQAPSVKTEPGLQQQQPQHAAAATANPASGASVAVLPGPSAASPPARVKVEPVVGQQLQQQGQGHTPPAPAWDPSALHQRAQTQTHVGAAPAIDDGTRAAPPQQPGSAPLPVRVKSEPPLAPHHHQPLPPSKPPQQQAPANAAIGSTTLHAAHASLPTLPPMVSVKAEPGLQEQQQRGRLACPAASTDAQQLGAAGPSAAGAASTSDTSVSEHFQGAGPERPPSPPGERPAVSQRHGEGRNARPDVDADVRPRHSPSDGRRQRDELRPDGYRASGDGGSSRARARDHDRGQGRDRDAGRGQEHDRGRGRDGDYGRDRVRGTDDEHYRGELKVEVTERGDRGDRAGGRSGDGTRHERGNYSRDADRQGREGHSTGDHHRSSSRDDGRGDGRRSTGGEGAGRGAAPAPAPSHRSTPPPPPPRQQQPATSNAITGTVSGSRGSLPLARCETTASLPLSQQRAGPFSALDAELAFLLTGYINASPQQMDRLARTYEALAINYLVKNGLTEFKPRDLILLGKVEFSSKLRSQYKSEGGFWADNDSLMVVDEDDDGNVLKVALRDNFREVLKEDLEDTGQE